MKSLTKDGRKGKEKDDTEEAEVKVGTTKLVESVAHTSSNADDDDDVARMADLAITEALSHATESSVEGRSEVNGNPSEILLLQQNEKLEQLFNQITLLQTGNKEFEQQIQGHSRQIESLNIQIRQLKDASTGYREVRHRFLDVYRRNLRNLANPHISARTRAGNQRTHAGDCVTDGALYENEERDDDLVFVYIYNLTYQKVQLLAQHKNNTAIERINEFGTWEVDKDINIPNKVKTAFSQFCLEVCDHPSKNLDHYEAGEPLRSYMNYINVAQDWRQEESNRKAAERAQKATT